MEESTNPIDAVASWYVTHCKPYKEATVATALQERLGLGAYLPTVRGLLRGQGQPAPLFPGYVFVWAELHSQAISAINAIPGVLRLLAFGGQPQAVPPAVIDEIRKRVDRLNAQGGWPAHQFSRGEPVRLTAGPLRGLEAVFLRPMQSSERVKVLIEFLGQLREAELHVSALEKAGPSPSTKRPRRTRGRGRPIKALYVPAKSG